MSTTDTIRAAFVAAKAKMIRTGDGWTDFEMFEAGHKAATEAAKATGTAGEHSHQGNRYGNLTDAEYIEMTRQEAARQPAPVDQPIGPISDWTLPRLYDLACRQRHEIRESDKCIKRYADELVAVRQSSQMPKVKIWQDRFEESYGRNPFDGELVIDERDEEIAELRAALAATAAPVLSDERIDWLANCACSGGIAYPSQVKTAIRDALREAATNRSQP